ncbi:uncharacterized protein LOC106065593 isoform X1 [Biomphalaria glabrata]|uniref:Uncharacterized protein LOC106065593 isoform X1 n=2 Tax=Biomphalaria glabrata TaxID=6526 RepID=A0A9W3AF79_BIOGL|nr:uncharacterized protein LOC106065593 isoform X1 [Biomphalaria glabrata]
MAAIFCAITCVLISVVSCDLLCTKEISVGIQNETLNSVTLSLTVSVEVNMTKWTARACKYGNSSNQNCKEISTTPHDNTTTLKGLDSNTTYQLIITLTTVDTTLHSCPHPFTTQTSPKKRKNNTKNPQKLDPNDSDRLQAFDETLINININKTTFTLSTADLEGTTEAHLTANSQTSFTDQTTTLFQSSPTTNSNFDQVLETTDASTTRASVLNSTVKAVARDDTKQSTMGHGLVWWIAVVGGAGLAVIILLSSLTFLFYRPWRKNKMVQLRRHPPKKTNENLYGKMKTSARTSNSLKRIRKKNSCYSKVLDKETGGEDDQYQRTQSIFSWGTEFDAFDPISERDTVSTKGGYANTTLLFSQANVQALTNTTSSESDLGTGCSPNCSSDELLGKYINANTIV